MPSAGGDRRGIPARDDLLRLPVEVQTRLRDIPRHLRALQALLAATDEDRYTAAARSSDPDVLAREVYPLERAFEILGNYVAELAAVAARFVGLAKEDTVQNLRRLSAEGAIPRSRAQRLIDIHRTRNNLVHQYPDMRARVIIEAATLLEGELAAFLRDYTSWFINRLDETR